MTEPQDVLAENPLAEALRANGISPYVKGTGAELRFETGFAAALATRGYALSRTPETLDATDVYATAMLGAWRKTKDFLRDRLLTSGRSDVSVNAVLRVMNEALNEPDSGTPSEVPDVGGTLRGAPLGPWMGPGREPTPKASGGAPALVRTARFVTLDAAGLLATLQDRFHEVRAGTPEWRDGVRLGLQIAMNEVGYAATPAPDPGAET